MTAGSETLLDLSLARGVLHRSASDRRHPDIWTAVLSDASTRVIDLIELTARVCTVNGQPRLVHRSPQHRDRQTDGLFLGRDEAGVAYVASTTPTAVPPEGTWVGLREAGAHLGDTDAAVFTSAVALAQWHARHPHCPRCGAATEIAQGGWVRRCPRDESEHHPRTDPAVIMAITDDQDRLLLGQGTGWSSRRRSILAGFVEAGESLEAAVRREVLEEVGLQIDDLHYRGNQPWPFPASLMVGFTARAAQTDLTLDPEEIAAAEWYTRGELSSAARQGVIVLPTQVSIARRLIEEWYGGPLQSEADPGRGGADR